MPFDQDQDFDQDSTNKVNMEWMLNVESVGGIHKIDNYSIMPDLKNSTLLKQLFLTNPKSKSKVQVQVWADDWVFIKIKFSNQPPSPFLPSSPASHLATQQAGKVSKKQDTAINPKQKLLVYIRRL